MANCSRKRSAYSTRMNCGGQAGGRRAGERAGDGRAGGRAGGRADGLVEQNRTEAGEGDTAYVTSLLI